MADRRLLLAVVLFAAGLHGLAISRTLLPAQDGLKYIAVARDFHTRPWEDVVRGTDVHPLYPALVAVVEPAVAWWAGEGSSAWRIAAQLVSVMAALALVVPMHGLTKLLFDRRIAVMAAALVLLYPRAAALGHETLADSVGLLGTLTALWLGLHALLRSDPRLALLSGLAAGLGYLARPEVVLTPAALAAAWLTTPGLNDWRAGGRRALTLLVLLVGFTSVLGSYTMVKGELSEKLALRLGAALGHSRMSAHPAHRVAPRGLDDPRWDFSPKEESERISISGWRQAASRITGLWWEESCWGFAIMAGWGFVRRGFIRGHCPEYDPVAGRAATGLLLAFSVIYALALVRHSALLGYLSGRHTMALLMATTPWSAAGVFVCARGIAVKSRMGPGLARGFGVAALLMVMGASAAAQTRPSHMNHLSRLGHLEAGRWLARNATPDEMVLDTRGWARFVSGQPGYDYWHVRQALTDAHLRYIVVGLDELEARSRRAASLRTLLARTGTPVVEFPGGPGDSSPGVRIYRFERPRDWEDLFP